MLDVLKKYRLLRRNPGFFDAKFYVSNRHGIGRFLAKKFPLADYLLFGANFAPNALFDIDHYRRKAGLKFGNDAALHYLQYGWRHGLDPHPFFDTAHYLFAYPDVAAAGIDPLSHYLLTGAAEARRPNPLFKPDYYILTAGVSLSDALRHYYETADIPTRQIHAHDRLRLRGKVGRIDDYARETNQSVIDLPGEAACHWRSPHIINRDRPQEDLQAPLPAPYVAVLKNVTAFPGTRLLLAENNRILHDELANERAPFYLDKLKAIGHYSDGICTISAAYVGLSLKKALIVSSDTDFNYFHMLVETLPKLQLAEAGGCPADVPILIQDGLHSNLVTALERASKGRPIIYAPWGSAIRVEELWYASDMGRVINPIARPSDIAYDVAMSPRAVQEARRLLMGTNRQALGTKKIYMSRNSHYRHLANQDEFMALLKAKDFDIIDTGRMTLQEQIDAMADAALVIAPSGAALTNLLWCAPGARILILMADHPLLSLHLFNQIGQALNVTIELYLGDRIYDMNGTYSFHDSFEADLNVIAQWCDRQNAQAA